MMRKIKIGFSAGWVFQKYEDIIEISDDEDPDEVTRELAMEQFEWWWNDVEDEEDENA